MNRHDTLKLESTDEQLHSVAVAVDKVRRSSTTVKVDRQALAAILIDHSRMIDRLAKAGIEAA